MRKIKCHRAAGIHLIGFDLIYALCHAEHLVFMDQTLLPYKLQRKAASLRWTTEDGSSTSKSPLAPGYIGFKPGMDGYCEAVTYIYNIFDEPFDTSALRFEVLPPKFSPALSKSPATIDEYVADLWDASCENSESTFTALFIFTLV